MNKAKQLKQNSIKNLKMALPNIIVISILIGVIRFAGLGFWYAMGLFFLYSLFAQVVIQKERNIKTILKGFSQFAIFAVIIWFLIKYLGAWGVAGPILIILLIGAYILYKRRHIINEGTDMIVATIKEAMDANKKNKKSRKRTNKKRTK